MCSSGEKMPSIALLEHEVTYTRLREFADQAKHQKNRIVYTEGIDACGVFEVTQTGVTPYCKAPFFSSVGQKTNVTVRFSQQSGKREDQSTEVERDVRGFAVKFDTTEGPFDLVGNNFPITFVRHPKLYPDMIHALQRDVHSGKRDLNRLWSFLGDHPEAFHHALLLYSDRGIPDGYRHMNGYGVNIFANINASKQKHFVRYHWLTQQKIQNLLPEKAEKLRMDCPMYATKDLMEAIQKKHFPSWKLYAQVMSLQQAIHSVFNPFDPTRVWSHKEYPLLEVGMLTLTSLRHKDIKDSKDSKDSSSPPLYFSCGNLLPGIEPSLDRILHARLYAYPFAQSARKRSEKEEKQEEGKPMDEEILNPLHMGFTTEEISSAQDQEMAQLEKQVAQQMGSGDKEDNYSQARVFYETVLSDNERDRLSINIAQELHLVEGSITGKVIEGLTQVSDQLGGKIIQVLEGIKEKEKAEVEGNKFKHDGKKEESDPMPKKEESSPIDS